MSSPNQNPVTWDDKLTIETPEQTSLEFPLAGVGSRCMAMVLDTLIQFAGIFVLLILLLILQTQFPSTAAGLGSAGLWVQAVIFFTLFVIYFGYFALFEALWNGQTPGKRVAHLRVIQESGRPVEVGQVIVRNLLRVVDQLPGFYAVGIVSALISKQNRRLGDFAGGTVVVHERPLTKVEAAWATAPKGIVSAAFGGPPPLPAPTMLGAARLGPEEVKLIEAFLERRNSLDWEVRGRMARQITARISERLGIDTAKRVALGLVSEEVFLETVARERAETRSR